MESLIHCIELVCSESQDLPIRLSLCAILFYFEGVNERTLSLGKISSVLCI